MNTIGLREELIGALVDELLVQNPDAVLEAKERWRLSGGCTPQSSGTSLSVGDLADAVLARFSSRQPGAGCADPEPSPEDVEHILESQVGVPGEQL